MRPRHAVLQIPPKSSVPRRLLLYKNSHPLTPSESTLPQVLISLHFNSFISNTYKKPGGGPHSGAPKFGNSSSLLPNLSLPRLPNLSFRAQRGICCFLLPSLCLCLITSLRRYFAFPRSCAHTPTPANLIASRACAHLPSPPGWGCTVRFPSPMGCIRSPGNHRSRHAIPYFARRVFQRTQASSRAFLFASLASGASPARMKPWPAPS